MLQGALAGLAAGGVYAVVAVCLTMMAQLVRVINFSQAAIGMFGAFTSVLLIANKVPHIPAVFLGILVSALLSGIIGWIIATWLPDASISARSAVTIAALLFIISLSFILFGTKPKAFKAIVSGPAFEVSGVVVSKVTIVMVLFAVVLAVVSKLVLGKTKIGVKLRAIADKPVAAELIGIPVKPLAIGVWVVTGLVVGLAVAIVAPTQNSDAVSLSMLVIYGSAASLLGAFKRLDLALVGGLLLGAVQGAAAQFQVLSLARDWIPLLAIVVFLLWNQRKEVWDAAR
ncbi:ABC transporter permease subunit [Paeniglutamicibacter cryotolerans]|uniref:Branched-chain amino acid transport system permease protein n=1 Tax=Paeniglutamicibacter cryotolerans TaxID=670079 RepID=A0A839QIV9_9MICC|nr:branched-chain amino acid ABC transporter permease [Paeniglutamicibacter cryotolerans]MBB2995737.1 branched-chain amino acid transport system permease protein [Paeniglutamicibacter cryotolerans]